MPRLAHLCHRYHDRPNTWPQKSPPRWLLFLTLPVVPDHRVGCRCRVEQSVRVLQVCQIRSGRGTYRKPNRRITSVQDNVVYALNPILTRRNQPSSQPSRKSATPIIPSATDHCTVSYIRQAFSDYKPTFFSTSGYFRSFLTNTARIESCRSSTPRKSKVEAFGWL